MSLALSSSAHATGSPGPRRISLRAASAAPRPGAAHVAASVLRVRERRRLRLLRLASRVILAVGLTGAVASGVLAYRTGGPYGDRNDVDPRLRRVYDPGTGKLTMVAFAADGSLRIDHWCEMDGERLLRMDVDENADGVPDRREHYGPGEKLERTE